MSRFAYSALIAHRSALSGYTTATRRPLLLAVSLALAFAVTARAEDLPDWKAIHVRFDIRPEGDLHVTERMRDHHQHVRDIDRLLVDSHRPMLRADRAPPAPLAGDLRRRGSPRRRR